MTSTCAPRAKRLPSHLVADEQDLVLRLQAGEEGAFVELVRLYQSRLLRLAQSVVWSPQAAEDAVQDTWLAVVRGIERFEGRSSFKTWLFHVLLNRARSAAGRDTRSAPLADGDVGERFDAAGAWATPPAPWAEQVDDRIVAEQLAARVWELVPTLPPGPREVLILRDLEGLAPAEVCSLLGISDGNQRVMLHRGRAQIRRQLEMEMAR